MEGRDTKGDLYEYMLSKLTTAGTNGQFRTPRHIIKMMVEVMAPTAREVVCDPACGTGGFLVGVAEYLQNKKDVDRNLVLNGPGNREHFNREMFHGFDFDPTMLRIGSMNMMLNGIENPKIEARDSLSEDHAAVIVPDGMMFGSSNAHRKLREILVEEHKLYGVISMPSGCLSRMRGVRRRS